MGIKMRGKNRFELVRALLCLAFLCGAVFLGGCGSREAGSFMGEPGEPGGSGAESAASLNAKVAAASPSLDAAAADPVAFPSTANLPAASKAPDSPAAAPSACGRLSVKGTSLVDKDGNPVQLRGISTHGLAWFPGYVNDACFKELHEKWNANVVRLAMYTAEYGGYCTGGDQKALQELITDGVGYAAQNDMYVILDWHILSDGNPNTYKKEAKKFFKKMAKKFAGCGNVLYEICNEPNGGTTWAEIKAYAEEVIDTIRKQDPDSVILVGTPNWSQFVDEAAADPIDRENIMYTLHFYAATHKEALRNKLVAAVNDGLPLFVSEFGICDASGSGAIDKKQANLWIEELDRQGISYVAWNLSNKDESSALLKSSCQKTSGFKKTDLSPAGKWIFSLLNKKGASGTVQSSAASKTTSPASSSAASKTTPPAASSSAGQKTAAGTPSKAANEKEESVTLAATVKGITCTAVKVNSWESNGKCYDQFELTLENTGKKDRTNWSVQISFKKAMELFDSWNGDYTIKGKKLSIHSKAYNGDIPAGGTIGNVGFIVCGSSHATITGD